ncbi:MAG TPA: plastocyanin/azurin family copper-binding protein [Vicinamibacterales bacterium]|nr:plastocyanin/azurin family copper-binding protein [Vicinamibacterales bacterium]
MLIRIRTLCAAIVLAAVAATTIDAAAAPRTIVMKGGDDMKYDVVSITAKPGETLRVQLVSTGKIPKFAMAHNFVLLKAGTDAKAFADKAMQATPASSYIPAALKGQVLAFTQLAGPGETVEVTFTAPSAPGKYEYICTFPGHYAAGMKGVLIVK